MATVVGFLDLNKQMETVASRIETQLRSVWLDGETAHELKKEFYFKRRKAEETKNIKLLDALLDKINREISWRKRQFGDGGRSAEA